MKTPRQGLARLPHPDPFVVCSVVLPFAIYMATLAPSVTFFDSGEFLTASASLGSAHSPGYPLFLMYLKMFSLIPLGNIAFRINMGTAFSSSLACLGVYLLTVYLLRDERLTEEGAFASFARRMAGLAAACAFAVTPRLWLQSNHDKPYPLLAFITGVIFLILLKWSDEYRSGNERPGHIYACTFLAGLTMSLHQSVVLLLPAWILLILLTDWRLVLRIKELLLATSFAMLGFAAHLYLPLRAVRNPLLNWGDPKDLGQFLWHFLRRGYPTEPPQRDFSLFLQQVMAFNPSREFTWIGILLLLLGLVLLWKRQRSFLFAYGISIFTFLLVIAGHFNTPPDMIFLTEEFFTPVYLLTAVGIGAGLFHLLSLAMARTQFSRLGLKVRLLVTVLFLVLPVTLCAMNYYENDQHDNYIAFDYATNSLRSLPQNAVMFTWGDSGAFPLWYLQGIERMREDVDLPHTPHIVFDWYMNSMPRLFSDSNLRRYDIQSLGPEGALHIAITDTIGQRPTYIDFSTRYSINFQDYLPVQKGIVYRMRRVSEPGGIPDTSVWENYSNRGIIERISFLDLDTGKAILIYANSYMEAGDFLISINHVREGMEMLHRAQLISPELSPSVQQILARYGLVGGR